MKADTRIAPKKLSHFKLYNVTKLASYLKAIELSARISQYYHSSQLIHMKIYKESDQEVDRHHLPSTFQLVGEKLLSMLISKITKVKSQLIMTILNSMTFSSTLGFQDIWRLAVSISDSSGSVIGESTSAS
jgi:hypothetical protein